MQCWQKEESSGFTPRLKLSKIVCTVRLPYLADGGELEKLLCFISYTPLILGDSDTDSIEFCSDECFETVFVPSWSDQFLQNKHVGGGDTRYTKGTPTRPCLSLSKLSRLFHTESIAVSFGTTMFGMKSSRFTSKTSFGVHAQHTKIFSQISDY